MPWNDTYIHLCGREKLKEVYLFLCVLLKIFQIFLFKICKQSVLSDSFTKFEHNLPNVSYRDWVGHLCFIDSWWFTTFKALKCSAINVTLQYIVFFYSSL